MLSPLIRGTAFLSLSLALVFLHSAGCATQSDRRRLDATAMVQIREAQAGTKAFRTFLSTSDVMMSHDPVMRDRVLRVFVRLVEAGKRSSFADVARQLPWEYAVLQNDEKITGVAFPGGKIGLYTGLIAATETDDELAAAIGHLMAKVLTRHQAKDISRSFMKQAGAVMPAAGSASRQKSDELELVWRQTQREQADYVGMLLSADAGYDPGGAIVLYRRLEGPDSPRAKKLEGHLAEALTRFNVSKARSHRVSGGL
jgi:predicted Zn-dependent protease